MAVCLFRPCRGGGGSLDPFGHAGNWILFMHGWFCPIRLIHLFGQKSVHLKKLDWGGTTGIVLYAEEPRNDNEASNDKSENENGLYLNTFTFRNQISSLKLTKQSKLVIFRWKNILYLGKLQTIYPGSRKWSEPNIRFMPWNPANLRTYFQLSQSVKPRTPGRIPLQTDA